ncbi:DUF4236 domain-containing protein [Bacillus sp. FSL W8-0223]|uniref:DUF4236 domain-containing protein n=1 Tax=Bacillus sp. FSL W8-0223 TaxID=2954595 RepID=UPI004046AC05
MGFRVRIPITKNVRLNVSRKSVGISAGTKGVRASVSSKGYINTSVGNGSVSYTHTHKIGKNKKKPSLFELLFGSRKEG